MTERYSFAPGRRLLITDGALEMFCEHRQAESSCPEAGGVLLGRHLLESPDIVIDEATSPQAADRRSRTSFFRSEMHHTAAIRRWEESRGKVAYLGLWHSHPEPVPTPSGTDLNDWRKALRQDLYEGDFLFFIIVGTQEIGCWAGRRWGPFTKITQLRTHPKDDYEPDPQIRL